MPGEAGVALLLESEASARHGRAPASAIVAAVATDREPRREARPRVFGVGRPLWLEYTLRVNADRLRTPGAVEVHVDGRAYALRGPTATGAEIKALVPLDAPSRLYREKGVLEPKDAPDEAIADRDPISVRGGMRFYTISESRLRDNLFYGVPWREDWKRRLSKRAGLVVALAGVWIVALDGYSPSVVAIKLLVAGWLVAFLAALAWPPRATAKRRGDALVLRRTWQGTLGVAALALLLAALFRFMGNAATLAISHIFFPLAFEAAGFSWNIRVTAIDVEARFLLKRTAIRWSDVRELTLERNLFWNPAVIVLRPNEGAPVNVPVALNGFPDFATRALAVLPPSALRGDPQARALFEAIAPLAAQQNRAAGRRVLVRG